MKSYLRNVWLWITGWGKLHTLQFKPGWSAWGWKPLWFVYLTTYLLGVLFGCGVVSLSQFWYERSEREYELGKDGYMKDVSYPFSRFMTRFLNWALPGKVHGALTGPRLWGSQPCGWWK